MTHQKIPFYLLGLSGSIGDLTFYKSGDQYIVRKKPGPRDPEQLATAPQFLRTRQNMAEFGRAAKNAKLFRTAFGLLQHHVKSQPLHSRLVQVLMKIQQSDTVNERGNRCIADGDLALLKGFDINEDKNLGQMLFVAYTTNIDRHRGIASVMLPSFRTRQWYRVSSSASHFRIVSSVMEINFETEEYDVKQSSTPIFSKSERFPATQINHPVRANSSGIIILLLGIELYQKVGKELYALDEGANALQVVDVNGK